MFGFLVFCIIIFVIYKKAKKENAKNLERKRNLFETAKKTAAETSSKSNRALRSMREAAKGLKENIDKEMPIEQRRKRQKEASDRSRIHQSLHKKEKQRQQQNEIQQTVQQEIQNQKDFGTVPEHEMIRFSDNELMDEVYAIMACGYPAAGCGQRDFIEEGMTLLYRNMSA